MEWDGGLGDWLEAAAAEGHQVGPSLGTRPDLAPHLTSVWAAFWELGSDRALGYGTVGPIPFTAIDAYARRYDIGDPDDFDRFLALIRAMEGVRAEHLETRRKAEEAEREG